MAVTDYRAEYAKKTSASYTTWIVNRGRELLTKYGPWIDKYRGGLPAGFAANIMAMESNGNPTLGGDATLGEYGLFQVAADVPAQFGLAAGARMDPETNVFIGLMEYQVEAIKWKLAFPSVVQLGTADSWKLARLSFAVGGSIRTFTKDYVKPGTVGRVYDAIVSYVDKYGAKQLGSQSAEKVWYRIKLIQMVWDTGQKVRADAPGLPVLVAAPPQGSYTIKPTYLAYFTRPSGAAGLIGALALLLTGLWLYSKSKVTA